MPRGKATEYEAYRVWSGVKALKSHPIGFLEEQRSYLEEARDILEETIKEMDGLRNAK